MSFEVKATDPFRRKVKKLTKKHASLKGDLAALIASLGENPTQGTPLEATVIKSDWRSRPKEKGNPVGDELLLWFVLSAKLLISWIFTIRCFSYRAVISALGSTHRSHPMAEWSLWLLTPFPG
jgi:hypothetical protein